MVKYFAQGLTGYCRFGFKHRQPGCGVSYCTVLPPVQPMEMWNERWEWSHVSWWLGIFEKLLISLLLLLSERLAEPLSSQPALITTGLENFIALLYIVCIWNSFYFIILLIHHKIHSFKVYPSAIFVIFWELAAFTENFSRFTHVVACIRIHFWLPNNISS